MIDFASTEAAPGALEDENTFYSSSSAYAEVLDVHQGRKSG
jgi:hypothetical protein